MMFLFLDFLRLGEIVECMGYAMRGECPAFFNASAYGGIALSNDSRPQDGWVILLLIMRGSCLVMEDGWLDRVLM